MSYESIRMISADHPSLPGHFPGNPIVPAVVILDEVSGALREWRETAKLKEIVSAKFLSPLLPDKPFTVRLTQKSEQRIRFECMREDQLFAEGVLVVGSLDLNNES